MHRFRGVLAGLLAMGLVLLTSGCAARTDPVTVRGEQPGIAPALAVERFLGAANAKDLNTMGRLFGTRAGSILERDPRSEVEHRMFTLASILRHQNYTLAGEGIVPGRIGEAVRIMVRMNLDGGQVLVPFTVVRTVNDGWLVEQIDIEAITGAR